MTSVSGFLIKKLKKSLKKFLLPGKTSFYWIPFQTATSCFHKFESGDIKGFATHMEEYWGNILDYIQKIWDMVEDYNELIEGLSKTLIHYRQTEPMKLSRF